MRDDNCTEHQPHAPPTVRFVRNSRLLNVLRAKVPSSESPARKFALPLIIAAALVANRASAQPRYALTVIQPPPGANEVQASGLSSDGAVTGLVFVNGPRPFGATLAAFVWRNERITVLAASPGAWTRGTAITGELTVGYSLPEFRQHSLGKDHAAVSRLLAPGMHTVIAKSGFGIGSTSTANGWATY
ncbi:MAG: hypothetical protein U1D55_07280 [Phycisphaerae bacterium]